ncbi:MAG: cyclic nucleotide-binding domain-containing protein [Verrucomicrobiota bacterium]
MRNYCDFFSYLKLIDPEEHQKISEGFEDLGFFSYCNVIEQGTDHNDAVFLIESGVVEVIYESQKQNKSRVVAYLSRGDFFGELSILTKQPRVATIHAMEKVRLYKIDGEKFKSLLKTIPALGYYMTIHLAHRVRDMANQISYFSHCINLGGTIDDFDMLTTIQTISSSGKRGELLIRNQSSEIVGSFFFQDSQLIYAKFRHLRGLEACWQIILEANLSGHFAFEIKEKINQTYAQDTKIGMDTMDMLMQAATHRDHYERLPDHCRNMDLTIEQLSEKFSYPECPDPILAEKIWGLTGQSPQTLQSLWLRLEVSQYTFCQLVDALIKASQVSYHKQKKEGFSFH